MEETKTYKHNKKTLQNQLNIFSDKAVTYLLSSFKENFDMAQILVLRKLVNEGPTVLVWNADDSKKIYFEGIDKPEAIMTEAFKILIYPDINEYKYLSLGEISKDLTENVILNKMLGFFIRTNEGINDSDLLEIADFVNNGFINYFENIIIDAQELPKKVGNYGIDTALAGEIIEALLLIYDKSEAYKIVLNSNLEMIINITNNKEYILNQYKKLKNTL